LAEKMLYADNIFLVCEFNRRYIQETYPAVFPRIAGKIRLHQIGLDFDQLRYDPEGRSPCTVLAVGRLEPLKGLDILLRAAQRLRQHGVKVDVELVGGGEDETRLKRLAAELGMASHVRFRGWVPPAEVEKAMRR